jgi:hypothetical protein
VQVERARTFLPPCAWSGIKRTVFAGIAFAPAAEVAYASPLSLRQSIHVTYNQPHVTLRTQGQEPTKLSATVKLALVGGRLPTALQARATATSLSSRGHGEAAASSRI